jgi:hypothetical protein
LRKSGNNNSMATLPTDQPVRAGAHSGRTVACSTDRRLARPAIWPHLHLGRDAASRPGDSAFSDTAVIRTSAAVAAFTAINLFEAVLKCSQRHAADGAGAATARIERL